MEKRFLGNTGIKVSQIGFGVLPMGASQLDLPVNEGAELIQYALSKGISFFDTAQYYDTYRFMRPAFNSFFNNDLLSKDAPSQAPVISSKCLMSGYDDMREAVAEARRELGLDVIDIFLLHEVMSPDDFHARCGAWDYLKEAKNLGIIRAMGISTHHQDVCSFMADVPECDVVFPLINKNGLGIRNGSGPGTADGMANAINKCHDAGKGVYAMKVFGGGNLTSEYRECLDFVSNIRGVDAMVIGFTSKEEIDRAVEYAEGRLPDDYAPDTSKKKMFISQDDCIGCLACKNRCPNKAIYINKNGLSEIDHDICLTCGYCAPVCPVRALIMIDVCR
ncbi:MAG: hypothetical protein BZ138_06980 [Methanosphaera sp. rholeuAM270]|nr:MAG: hypothetical protein BZ138_06980 [Methanosphaera sp. rholeuAM270]